MSNFESESVRSGKPTPLHLTVAEIAEDLSDAIVKLADRVAYLEKMAGGMQKKLDQVDRHALVFMGDWQPEINYQRGSMVRFKGAVFTALHEVIPGKGAPPSRDGSVWSQVF